MIATTLMGSSTVKGEDQIGDRGFTLSWAELETMDVSRSRYLRDYRRPARRSSPPVSAVYASLGLCHIPPPSSWRRSFPAHGVARDLNRRDSLSLVRRDFNKHPRLAAIDEDLRMKHRRFI